MSYIYYISAKSAIYEYIFRKKRSSSLYEYHIYGYKNLIYDHLDLIANINKSKFDKNKINKRWLESINRILKDKNSLGFSVKTDTLQNPFYKIVTNIVRSIINIQLNIKRQNIVIKMNEITISESKSISIYHFYTLINNICETITNTEKHQGIESITKELFIMCSLVTIW